MEKDLKYEDTLKGSLVPFQVPRALVKIAIVPDSITHIQKAREKNTIFSAIFYIDFDTNGLFQI